MRVTADPADQDVAVRVDNPKPILSGTGPMLGSSRRAAKPESIHPYGHEAERMETLRGCGVLDSLGDGGLCRITALAARRFGAPMAAVAIVGAEHVWFEWGYGAPPRQVPREPGLSASAIVSDRVHVVRDAAIDPLTRDHGMVAGDPGVRFYAGAPLKAADGRRLGVLSVMDIEPRDIDAVAVLDLVDLAALAVDRIEARRAASGVDLMAREVHHRVMNSLQFVSGLLAIQARNVGGSAVEAHLRQAATRIDAVAEVHRHFCAADGESASCIAFLRRLCVGLEAILEKPVLVRGSEGVVAATWIQPIGLLVNELVTNAAKHGRGRIEVAFEDRPGGYVLTVSDEGPGPPPGFDPWAPGKGLGMQVIRTLTRQLGGILTAGARAEGGGFFEVAFQVTNAPGAHPRSPL